MTKTRLIYHYEKWLWSIMASAILFFAGAYSSSAVADDLPEIVSSELNQIDRKVISAAELRQQSGERQLVGAMLFSPSQSQRANLDKAVWLSDNFELLMPEIGRPKRLCLEFSNGAGTLRMRYLVNLIGHSRNVKLKVSYEREPSLIGPGGTFFAYPSNSEGTNIAEACDGENFSFRSNNDGDSIIIPARIHAADNERDLILNLNTGGADVSVQAIDEEKQEIFSLGDCYAAVASNGSYDRECVVNLPSPVPATVRFLVVTTGADGYRQLSLSIPD